MATPVQAVGKAKICKEMMVAAVDDAICIVTLKERDNVLSTKSVKDYVKVRIDRARAELDMLEQILREGA